VVFDCISPDRLEGTFLDYAPTLVPAADRALDEMGGATTVQVIPEALTLSPRSRPRIDLAAVSVKYG
jgi:hypothetical protein